MAVKVRRAIFITLTILFFLIGAGLIFYSRGARFDFKNWEIVQTGGIYLKSEPADALISMDRKPVENKSGLLQSGTLINNLRPGLYRVVMAKENYFSWEKEIRVESSTVAVFDGIILFPRQKPELVASPSDKFFSELNGVITQGELTQLSSLFNQLKERQLGLPGPVSVNKVLAYPYNDQKFIVMTDRALYSLDTEKRAVSQISSLNPRDFAFAGNEVFWFNEKGLFSYNLILRTQSQVALPPELKTVDFKKLEVSPSGETVAILKQNSELILFDRAANKVVSLGNGGGQFAFSPDSKKVAFVSQDKQLNVYAIKDGGKKDKLILEKVSASWSEIDEIAWHEDNNYLFLKDSESNLYFVEINDSPPINTIKAAENIKSFIYHKDDDSLYFEDRQGLWRVKL